MTRLVGNQPVVITHQRVRGQGNKRVLSAMELGTFSEIQGHLVVMSNGGFDDIFNKLMPNL